MPRSSSQRRTTDLQLQKIAPCKPAAPRGCGSWQSPWSTLCGLIVRRPGLGAPREPLPAPVVYMHRGSTSKASWWGANAGRPCLHFFLREAHCDYRRWSLRQTSSTGRSTPVGSSSGWTQGGFVFRRLRDGLNNAWSARSGDRVLSHCIAHLPPQPQHLHHTKRHRSIKAGGFAGVRIERRSKIPSAGADIRACSSQACRRPLHHTIRDVLVAPISGRVRRQLSRGATG